MKKLIFLLFSGMLVLGLASCTDDDNMQNSEDLNVITPSDETEPTDDQMSVKVTADLSANEIRDIARSYMNGAYIALDSRNNYRHVIFSTNNKEGVHFKTNTLFVIFKVGYGYYSAKGFSVG